MKISAIAKIAIKALMRNKVRSFLTMLGIIIGVAAVIAMLAIGQGATQRVNDQIEGMGTNVVMISSNFSSASTIARLEAGSGTLLQAEDADAIRRQVDGILYVSPVANSGGQIKYGNKNWRSQISGVDVDFPLIRNYQVKSGNMFGSTEVRSGSKVCILGSTVVENLFEDEDPVGKTVRIRNVPFKVIGVLEDKGQSGMGNDQDDIILAPYTTVLTRLAGHRKPLVTLIASAESEEAIADVKRDVLQYLTIKNRSTTENDFNVRSQTDIAEAAETISTTLTALLASIAGISLLVGGIGIMNIMLVSVTERIKEIGIRMAVGARKKDVLMQFIIEAAMISLLGGVIGIVLGYIAGQVIGHMLSWSVTISPWSVLISTGSSCLIGVFFGWYPARKAANLNLIDALRYE